MRTARAFAFALCAVVMAAAVAFAQTDKQPAPAPAQPDMAKMMEMMQPGPEHQHLAKLVGNWKAAIKMWMDPAGPPMLSEGTTEYVSILGGRYVEGRYKSMVMGQPFEGVSIDGYDRNKKQYFSLWLDTMGTGVMDMRGNFATDGKTMTMKGAMFDPMTGKDEAVRSVSTWLDDNTIRFEMYQARGGQETKSMEIVYTRM